MKINGKNITSIKPVCTKNKPCLLNTLSYMRKFNASVRKILIFNSMK